MTTIELPPTGLGTATAVGCWAGCWTTVAAGAEYTGGADAGGGGGGAVTRTDEGSDAQPASMPIAPQTANSASDGFRTPSARAEIFVFIRQPQTRKLGVGSRHGPFKAGAEYPMCRPEFSRCTPQF